MKLDSRKTPTLDLSKLNDYAEHANSPKKEACLTEANNSPRAAAEKVDLAGVMTPKCVLDKVDFGLSLEMLNATTINNDTTGR